jgi:hypothetical protein
MIDEHPARAVEAQTNNIEAKRFFILTGTTTHLTAHTTKEGNSALRPGCYSREPRKHEAESMVKVQAKDARDKRLTEMRGAQTGAKRTPF